MKVIRDGLWLCVDCLFAAVNDDFTGLDYHYSRDEADKREKQIRKGLCALGMNLVPDFDSDSGDGHEEFATMGCDCCGSRLAGEMHRFAILGPDDYEACGDCGFDHAYEPSEARAWHVARPAYKDSAP